MPYVIGIVLSVAVALFARRAGFDRDRTFYPTVLIVIALYYVLFAAMSESVPASDFRAAPKPRGFRIELSLRDMTGK
jgi:hypothetical protein